MSVPILIAGSWEKVSGARLSPLGPDGTRRVSRVESRVLARETPGTSNVGRMAVVAVLEDVTVRRGTSILLDSVNLSIGENER